MQNMELLEMCYEMYKEHNELRFGKDPDDEKMSQYIRMKMLLLMEMPWPKCHPYKHIYIPY